jgi:hypothetical protein
MHKEIYKGKENKKRYFPRSMIPVSENDRNRPERGEKMTESGRKTPELDETWKQYSGQKFFGCFFLGDLRAFSAGKNEKLAGIYRKKSEDFLIGILLPDSIDFRCFLAKNRPVLLDLS